MTEYNFYPFCTLLSGLENLQTGAKKKKNQNFCLFILSFIYVAVFLSPTSFAHVTPLVTFTRSPTWVMTTRSQSSPLRCHWKRETPSSSNPGPSRTSCWWTNRRTCHPSCPVRSVCVCVCLSACLHLSIHRGLPNTWELYCCSKNSAFPCWLTRLFLFLTDC